MPRLVNFSILLCVTLTLPAHAQLVAKWSLDGNVLDSSGYGNHGTVSGATVTTGRLGDSGGAFRFDGVDDSISVPFSTSLDVQGDMSISAWVKTSSNYWRTQIVGNLPGYLPDTGYSLRVIEGKPHFGLYYNNNGTHRGGSLYGTSDIEDGQWHHVVGTYDGSSMQIYVDGQVQNSIPYTSGYDSRHSQLDIGYYYYPYSDLPTGDGRHDQVFNGSIDDVRIYDHALSSNEARALYLGAPTRKIRKEIPSEYRTYGFTVDGKLDSDLLVAFPLSFVVDNVPLAGSGLVEPGHRYSLGSDPELIPNEIEFDSVAIPVARTRKGSVLDRALQWISPVEKEFSGSRYAGINVGAIAGLEATIEPVAGSNQALASVELGLSVGLSMSADLVTTSQLMQLSGVPSVVLPLLPKEARDQLSRVALSIPVTEQLFLSRGKSFSGSILLDRPASESNSFVLGGSAEAVTVDQNFDYSAKVQFGEIAYDPSSPTLGDLLRDVIVPEALDANLLAKSETGSVALGNDYDFQMQTGSPVWCTFGVLPEYPVDKVSFDVQFLSEDGAEGLLAVYWDNELLDTIDERAVDDGNYTYIFDLPDYYGPGEYLLSFRLDPYSETSSAVHVGNVYLIPEPTMLGLLAMGTLAVLRRWRHV